MAAGWYLAALAFALLDWGALAFNRLRWRWVAKPAVMVALIAGYTQAGGWQSAAAWFGAGLVLSLLGDVLLLLPRGLAGGLAAFLVAHLAYVFAFSQPPAPPNAAVLPVIFALGAVVWVSYRRLAASPGMRRAGQSLRIAVLAYMLVISSMVVAALTSLYNPAWNPSAALLANIGALLFLVSDWVLANQRFIQPSRRGRVMVMVTYHLAQIILTGAFLLRAA